MNSDNFSLADLKSQGINVVKFTSPTCGPCKAAAVAVDEVSGEPRFGGIGFREVNVMDVRNASVVSQLNIKSVPVVAIAKDGEIKRIILGGEITAQRIADELDRLS